ncbi:MAG: hypothetical protein GX219_00760 [Tissierellia bacterium]|nr:hypothetical protein [Tissierellia bacterium]
MDTQYVFQITPDAFLNALPILGKGMLGIFIVMGVIILCVSLLNKVGSAKEEKI